MMLEKTTSQTAQAIQVQLEKPSPPADDDCCGGGACCPCVWDDYYEKLQKWRIQQAKLREQETN